MATVTHLPIPEDVGTQTREVHNAIHPTVLPGDRVKIPFGAYVWKSDTDGYISKRSVHVTVVGVQPGYVDVFDINGQGKGYVVLAELSWRGDGGRILRTKMTPEFCATSKILTPYIPRFDLRRRQLDYTPTYGPGYDNRDVE